MWAPGAVEQFQSIFKLGFAVVSFVLVYVYVSSFLAWLARFIVLFLIVITCKFGFGCFAPVKREGGTAAAAPPPSGLATPALCGSCPLVTPYYCRLGDLLCFMYVYRFVCALLSLHVCLCCFCCLICLL